MAVTYRKQYVGAPVVCLVKAPWYSVFDHPMIRERLDLSEEGPRNVPRLVHRGTSWQILLSIWGYQPILTLAASGLLGQQVLH